MAVGPEKEIVPVITKREEAEALAAIRGNLRTGRPGRGVVFAQNVKKRTAPRTDPGNTVRSLKSG